MHREQPVPEEEMHNAPREHSKSLAGFTLLEVLVTFAISAVLLAGLASLSGTMLRGWDRSTRLLENQSAVFNAVDRMVEELSGAIPFHDFTYNEEGDDGPSYDDLTAIFEGLPNRITIVRPAIGFETRHDLNRVSYFLERAGNSTLLVRRSQQMAAYAPFSADRPATRTVLAEFEGSMLFEFGDGRNFVEQHENALVRPRAIRIKFTLSGFPGRTFSKVAITQIDVGPYCVPAADDNYKAICNVLLARRP